MSYLRVVDTFLRRGIPGHKGTQGILLVKLSTILKAYTRRFDYRPYCKFHTVTTFNNSIFMPTFYRVFQPYA